MPKPKVIGVGFHKTGTTTLGVCLKMLGYNHISHSREAFLLHHAGQTEALLTLMDFFDSFEDWPWPFLYREAYERFPGARFILTTRLDAETWFESLAKHVARGDGGPFPFRRYIYGHEDPTADKQLHIDTYLRHNQEVRQFFSDKPGTLLEVCWERGDGWNELGGFLGVDAPALPFPRANRASRGEARRAGPVDRLRAAARILLKG